jgi:aryl-alcohol dehydrogenase-like predicted oxidoreductase
VLNNPVPPPSTPSSQTLLGDMMRKHMAEGGARPLLCTKFAALPWRLGRKAVVQAAQASLERLGVGYVDAYMVHGPGVWMNEEYAEGEPALPLMQSLFQGRG